MKVPKRGLLLTLMAVALLVSVACDYASITAPGAIEAPVTSNALPANESNSEDDALLKKGKKSDKNNGSSVSAQDEESTRYGWAY